MKKYPFTLSGFDKLVDSYFNVYLKENPDVIPDTESLAAYLGITRDEFNSLETHKTVGRTVLLAKTRIAAAKKQLAFRGKLPATVLAFDLRNDHGYRDKPEENNQSTLILKGEAENWGE